MISVLEWTGCVCGLIGAFLLAMNTRASQYGWWAFLAANIAMIGFALQIKSYGLALQQVGFLLTSLFGLYRAKFPPKCKVKHHCERN